MPPRPPPQLLRAPPRAPPPPTRPPSAPALADDLAERILSLLQRVDANLTEVRRALQDAAAARLAAHAAMGTATALPQAADALSCGWAHEAHAGLKGSVCLEVVGSWAVLALLLPLVGVALLIDAMHARELVGPPPLCGRRRAIRCCFRVSFGHCARGRRQAKLRRERLEAEQRERERAAAEAARARELARVQAEREDRVTRMLGREQHRRAAPRIVPTFGVDLVRQRVAAAWEEAMVAELDVEQLELADTVGGRPIRGVGGGSRCAWTGRTNVAAVASGGGAGCYES